MEPPLRGSIAGGLHRGSRGVRRGKVIQATGCRAWTGGVAAEMERRGRFGVCSAHTDSRT